MDQFNQMPVQKKPNPFKWILIGAGLFSCIFIVLCGVGFYLIQQEIEQTEEAYGETIVGMCNPIRTETVASDVTLSEEYPLQIVIFGEDSKTRHFWHDDLPGSWQADNKDETDLVVCVRDKEDIIEACEYTSIDDVDEETVGTLQRVQLSAEIFIFTTNGDLVNMLEVSGDIPAECPDTRRINGTEQEKGDPVSYAQFEDVIRPIVETNTE